MPPAGQQGRPWTAGLAAAAGIFCLLLGSAPPALALDPGDGSVLDTGGQLTRQLDTGKPERLRLPGKQDPPPAEKAELSVYQLFAMHFGTLVDNDGYVVLGTGDAILQDPDHLVYGGVPQSAQIRFSGDPFVALSVDFTAGSAMGLVLSAFDTDYGAPPLSGLSLDASGLLTLSVGARLQLDAALLGAGGGQQIGYTVTAIYE